MLRTAFNVRNVLILIFTVIVIIRLTVFIIKNLIRFGKWIGRLFRNPKYSKYKYQNTAEEKKVYHEKQSKGHRKDSGSSSDNREAFGSSDWEKYYQFKFYSNNYFQQHSTNSDSGKNEHHAGATSSAAATGNGTKELLTDDVVRYLYQNVTSKKELDDRHKILQKLFHPDNYKGSGQEFVHESTIYNELALKLR